MCPQIYSQEDIWLILDGTTDCGTHQILHGPGIDQPLAFIQAREDCDFGATSDPVGFLQT